MVDSDDISDSKDWQNAKEQLDKKDLLMRQTFAIEQCLEELRLIRTALSADTSSQPQQYQCDVCGSQVPEPDLEPHGVDCFGYMAEMGNIKSHFSEV